MRRAGFWSAMPFRRRARIDCDIESLGADAIVFSAHKFGGPKGAGALCFRSTASHIREALLRGGGQERGLRAGTENVAGIAGMAAALCAAEGPAVGGGRGPLRSGGTSWRRNFARRARTRCFSAPGRERLPNTSCFAVPGIEAQVLLMALDMEGIAVSSGSACSSGKVKRFACLARDGRGAGGGRRRDQGQSRVEFAAGRLRFVRRGS